MAIVPMPEATVYEDYGPVLGEHKVWLAWQTLVMQQISEALRVKASPDDHFGLRVLAADAGHHPASDLG